MTRVACRRLGPVFPAPLVVTAACGAASVHATIAQSPAGVSRHPQRPVIAARQNVYYLWYMSLRRTNVYADAEDLRRIKEAASRRGIPEAEIIREGIRLAAMSSRVWDEPLDWPTFEGNGEPALGDEVTTTVARGAARP